MGLVEVEPGVVVATGSVVLVFVVLGQLQRKGSACQRLSTKTKTTYQHRTDNKKARLPTQRMEIEFELVGSACVYGEHVVAFLCS